MYSMYACTHVMYDTCTITILTCTVEYIYMTCIYIHEASHVLYVCPKRKPRSCAITTVLFRELRAEYMYEQSVEREDK